MKAVTLTSGSDVTVVDDEDFERVSRHRWFLNVKRNGSYALASINGESVGLHRFILGLKKGDGLLGDHIDGNGLNNRRSNLRVATASDNQRHQVNRIPKYGYRGIVPIRAKWRAQLQVKGTTVYLGYFPTKEAAAHAYDESASKVYGEFAVLNFPAHASALASRAADAEAG